MLPAVRTPEVVKERKGCKVFIIAENSIYLTSVHNKQNTDHYLGGPHVRTRMPAGVDQRLDVVL